MQNSRDKSILLHTLGYCERIDKNKERFGKTQNDFINDESYQETIAFCLLQIGELISHLSDDFKKNYSKIPWHQIKAMRNVVAHKYGSIDKNIVWKTLENDIPELRKYCYEILAESEENEAKIQGNEEKK